MQNKIEKLRDTPQVSKERVADLRIAIRQLDSAELYVVAVEHLDLGDHTAGRAVGQLRGDLVALKRYLKGLIEAAR